MAQGLAGGVVAVQIDACITVSFNSDKAGDSNWPFKKLAC